MSHRPPRHGDPLSTRGRAGQSREAWPRPPRTRERRGDQEQFASGFLKVQWIRASVLCESAIWRRVAVPGLSTPGYLNREQGPPSQSRRRDPKGLATAPGRNWRWNVGACLHYQSGVTWGASRDFLSGPRTQTCISLVRTTLLHQQIIGAGSSPIPAAFLAVAGLPSG